MIKIRFTPGFLKIVKKIEGLKKIIPSKLEEYTRQDLEHINKLFHDGIKYDTLGLDALQDDTIRSKERRSYSYPSSPLYGKGDGDDDSYSNMLEIISQGNKLKLVPRKDIHHSGKVPLDFLFKIHEEGATMTVQRGGKSITIVIPPRPALKLAYRLYTSDISRKEVRKRKFSKSLLEYIKL